jgi:hypothetical protein
MKSRVGSLRWTKGEIKIGLRDTGWQYEPEYASRQTGPDGLRGCYVVRGGLFFDESMVLN